MKKVILLFTLLMPCFLVGCFGEKEEIEEEVSVLTFELNEETREYSVVASENVEEVKIPSTYKKLPVTSIAEKAFFECSNLINVVIPESIKSIGNYAFGSCSNLYGMVLPDGFESIGDYAFSNCSNMKAIRIPESIKYVGTNAFEGCVSLKYNIEGAFKYLGSNEYPHLVLVETVSEFYRDYTIYYDTKVICLSSYIMGNKLYYEGTIEDWLNINYTGIIEMPFYYVKQFYVKNNNNKYYDISTIEAIEIPNTMTKISKYQLLKFQNLTNLTIHNNVTSIDSDAFRGCVRLENVYYNGTIEDWCKIEFGDEDSNPMYYAKHLYMKDSNNEYYEITSMTEIEIPNTVTNIGDYQFCGFDNITSVVIPDSVTNIGYHAFYGCNSLERIVIPSSIKEINIQEIYDVDDIYYNGTIEDWCNIEFGNIYSNPMFYSKHFHMLDSNNQYYEVTEIEIPNTVSKIGDYQFSGLDNLTRVIISNKVTSIGSYAFYVCEQLEQVVFGEGVVSIEEYAFIGCINLTNVELPEALEIIGDGAFSWCNSFTSITIPKNVNSIGINAIKTLYNMQNIEVDPKNANYMSLDGNLYSKDGKTLILYASGKVDKTFVVPFSVVNIEDFAFYGSFNLENIELSDNLENIGYRAFYGCTKFKNVIIPEGTISIGEEAFRECEKLESIVIPKSLINMGPCVFANCSKVVIYCKAPSQPSSWDISWYLLGGDIIWGYTE